MITNCIQDTESMNENKNSQITYIKSRPWMTGSMRTAFRGAKRRCKSE